MEDPERLPNDDPSSLADDALELQRRAEEAMEQMLLAQEDHADTEGNGSGNGSDNDTNNINNNNNNIEENNNNNNNNFIEQRDVERVDGEDPHGFALDGHDDGGDDMHEDMELLDDDDMHEDMEFFDDDDEDDEFIIFNNNIDLHDSPKNKNPFTYVKCSLWAAVVLVYFAYRSRQQWYLALIFLSSSKYAYVILGNAFVASLILSFRLTTDFFLNGLRHNEAEGLGDYFRWHITETCLALTIFRRELNVKTFVLFLFLVFAKCLHHIVDTREAHLRMTQEIVVANPSNGWMSLRYPHVKLFALLCILQVLDIISVVLCAQDIMKNGPSATILFGFESAIMLTSVISNTLLWNLHLLDGILHFLHETSETSTRWHRWIYPWKDHKATLVFAVELQAQMAKFLFYLVFFSVVFANWGLPINLIREVYVSFLALKSRLVAFNKYRQLMSSMNRFKNPTEEELEEDSICIICRDEITVETAKRLPGCGHIMHKSCLREWLVQQQTCPTCRGDIVVMEARQKQQDAMEARRQEQQQEDEDPQQDPEEEENAINREGTEGGATTATEEDQPSSSVQENGKDKPMDGANHETAQPASSEVEHDTDRKPPPRTNPLSGRYHQPTIPTTKSNGIRSTASSSNGVGGNQEISGFPAFYRVVRDSGAPVYRHEEEEELQKLAFLVLRVVPCGVVFLGTQMEYRKCVVTNKMMVRMPDGWVNEDEVERIVAVPFESSSSLSSSLQ